MGKTMWKKIGAACVVIAMLSAAGIAGATLNGIRTRGDGPRSAIVDCPGGMSRLGHPFEEAMSLFAGDPAVHISDEYTVAEFGYFVEDIDTGAHAGTHLDAPIHFIEDARSVDELAAEEFVWPAYVMDVRGMTFENNFVEWDDIRAYERRHGRIRPGSLVILQTGAEEFWGAEVVQQDENDNVANVDDFFSFENAGFSGDAVQQMFDRRDIDGVGSDAYGPDASGDPFFDATYTTLLNDGVALVALANLDTVSTRGDVIMAPTVAMQGGSGFSTDPIACHGAPPKRR